MLVRILGSAAGGGLPQWNCACDNCSAARGGSRAVRPRTQCSLAVSADGRAWHLLNVSPDVRQQILAYPELGPASGVASRNTPIAGCILTDAELDHTAGLLLLREGTPVDVYSTRMVRSWLNRRLAIEPILASFSNATWRTLELDSEVELRLRDGMPSGLRARAFEVDRHVPRFVTDDRTDAAGSVVGLVIEQADSGSRLVYAPCVASLSENLRQAASQAACLLMDGTFWDDRELIDLGYSERTARHMGHVPVSGAEGSLVWLREQPVRHRAYIHINNTNPMLNERSLEHRQVVECGVRVVADGDTFVF